MKNTLAVIMASFLFVACATTTEASKKNNVVKSTGIASYYGKGDGFHGRTTASGKKFNAYGISAAHRTLKFGTKVKVTNLKNGKSVVVVINDRGPHKRTGRIIDLSYGAAQKIGMISSGVAKVSLQVIK